MEALKLFDKILKRITHYLLTRKHCEKFKNTIAASTRQISLFINRECEEFGMTQDIYNALMSYSKSNRLEFKSLISMGNFYFEGRNDYKTRLLVLTVGNGGDVISSHVPKQFTERKEECNEEEDNVGSKRKISVRGPGNKEFKSMKSASVISKALTENIIHFIDSMIDEYSALKKNQIIECLVLTIKKHFNVHGKEKSDESEINNKIVGSLKEYLFCLSTH